jgi:hypothetical protein
MKNRFYRIYFCGHYPIGAVAVMIAHSKQEALNLFQSRLQTEEPTLVEFNTDLTVDNVVELTERCTVLLNGEY